MIFNPLSLVILLVATTTIANCSQIGIAGPCSNWVFPCTKWHIERVLTIEMNQTVSDILSSDCLSSNKDAHTRCAYMRYYIVKHGQTREKLQVGDIVKTGIWAARTIFKMSTILSPLDFYVIQPLAVLRG